jgi:hypothetical protein
MLPVKMSVQPELKISLDLYQNRQLLIFNFQNHSVITFPGNKSQILVQETNFKKYHIVKNVLFLASNQSIFKLNIEI